MFYNLKCSYFQYNIDFAMFYEKKIKKKSFFKLKKSFFKKKWNAKLHQTILDEWKVASNNSNIFKSSNTICQLLQISLIIHSF